MEPNRSRSTFTAARIRLRVLLPTPRMRASRLPQTSEQVLHLDDIDAVQGIDGSGAEAEFRNVGVDGRGRQQGRVVRFGAFGRAGTGPGAVLNTFCQASSICWALSNRSLELRRSAWRKNSVSCSRRLGSNRSASIVASHSTIVGIGLAIVPDWAGSPVAIWYSVTAAEKRSACRSHRGGLRRGRNGSR